MRVEMRKIPTEIPGLKNRVDETKIALENLTNRGTATEDRISKVENELHNTSI